MADTALYKEAGGRRARSKAANRRAILDAARAVFARIGYEATTVRDIIRETTLAAGTFYNYFKSKEEVFEAIAADSTHRFRTRLDDVRAEAKTLEDYVRAGYRAYFQFLYEENCVALENGAPHLALIGVRVDTPEMKAVFDEIRADLEHAFLSGEAAQIDTEYLTAAAVGFAREMGDHMLTRRPVDVDAAANFATRMLLAGIKDMLADAG